MCNSSRMDPALLSYAALALAILAGAVVQSVVGLGLGLVAAPVMMLLAPELMPGTMLMLASVLPLLTLIRERSDIDWVGIGWALPARVVGTVIGVWIVATVSPSGLGVGVALMVLAAVALTWRTVRVPINRGTLMAGGLASGITGTTSSIGGPPFALLYQNRPPAQVRSTLAVFFLVGSVISLTGLGLGGELTTEEAIAAVALAPMLVIGTFVAAPIKRRLSPSTIRPAILTVCAASALVLLVRSLTG